MSFTTPIEIAGLTLSPLMFGAILACTIVIIGSITGYVRRRIRFKLEGLYSTKRSSWNGAMSATSQADKALRCDLYGLVNGQTVFTGASKETLDAARSGWALWSARRACAERILKEAQELKERFDRRRWWQLSHKPLRTALHKLTDSDTSVEGAILSGTALSALADLVATQTISGAKLILELQADAGKTTTELLRLQTAVQRANEANRRFVVSITGAEGLQGLKNSLAKTGELPFDPYTERFLQIEELHKQFVTLAKGDPLTDYSLAEQVLKGKVSVLHSALVKVLDLHSQLVTYRNGLRLQTRRVSALTSEPLKPGFPGAFVSAAAAAPEGKLLFAFTEDKDELDRQLEAAADLALELAAALVAGNASEFELVLPRAQRTVKQATKIVDDVLGAKAYVDAEMTTIIKESREADLEADHEDTAEIRLLYTAQKWRAASNSVVLLRDLHWQRVTTRAAVADMEGKLAVSRNALDAKPFIFSAVVDEFCADISEEAGRIKRTSDFGRTDWKSLLQDIAALVEQICGASPSSLAERIASQTHDYDQAQVSLHALTDKLADLQAKSGDRWGGASAAEMLAETAPSVEAVVEQSAVRKQPWMALHLSATSVMERLKPAEVLIADDLDKDAREFKVIRDLEAEIVACRTTPYVREVNGVEYGSGIYCNVAPAARLLQSAYVSYRARRYDQIRRDAALALDVLFKAHLESWWLCLQMMSMSDDFGARQFALQQGYTDYGFEYWMAKRIAESVAPITANANAAAQQIVAKYSLPHAFGATAKKAKAAHAVSFLLPGDAPAIKDYERSYAAKN